MMPENHDNPDFWIPDNPDGSGWAEVDWVSVSRGSRYHYQHGKPLAEAETERPRGYRVVTRLETDRIEPHENSYYVVAGDLAEFLTELAWHGGDEVVWHVEPIDSAPPEAKVDGLSEATAALQSDPDVAEVQTFLKLSVPEHFAVLSGPRPPDDQGFRSDRLQILSNRRTTPWRDPGPHWHARSDEAYLVLEGAINLQIGENHIRVGANEICFVPAGVSHAMTSVETPYRGFVIRGPALADKVYAGTGQDHQG